MITCAPIEPGFIMKPARPPIPQEARLRDVVDGLKRPIEYVRNVLLALSEHGAARNPDIQIRLSLQGDRTAPNYQIVEIMDSETKQPMELTAYSGKTHKEMA